jgi:hypothetical protein
MLDALSLIVDGLANLAKGPRSPREGVGWARGAWFPARGAWFPARGAWVAFCALVVLAGLGALVYSILR